MLPFSTANEFLGSYVPCVLPTKVLCSFLTTTKNTHDVPSVACLILSLQMASSRFLISFAVMAFSFIGAFLVGSDVLVKQIIGIVCLGIGAVGCIGLTWTSPNCKRPTPELPGV